MYLLGIIIEAMESCSKDSCDGHDEVANGKSLQNSGHTDIGQIYPSWEISTKFVAYKAHISFI